MKKKEVDNNLCELLEEDVRTELAKIIRTIEMSVLAKGRGNLKASPVLRLYDYKQLNVEFLMEEHKRILDKTSKLSSAMRQAIENIMNGAIQRVAVKKEKNSTRKTKTMDSKKRLNDLFKEVTELVPTIISIGRTKEGYGLMMMNSEQEGTQQKEEDISVCLSAMMQYSEQVRNIFLASVCHFMQTHPDYQQKMIDAIKLMQKAQWN